jgi:hypothetical protein
MTKRFLVDGVLRSLPPNYIDHVMVYVMWEESFTFHAFLDELRNLKVEPIAGEVIDGEGIYDIRVINVFSSPTLIAVY